MRKMFFLSRERAWNCVAPGEIIHEARREVQIAVEGNSESNPDGRIDYAADAMTGPFEMSMQRMTFFTSEPIQISSGSGISFYDAQCVISGPAPEADDPIPGVMTLQPGEELALALANVRDGAIDGRRGCDTD